MIKIEEKHGNLLHVTSGHIVHGCNAQGVMGSGVALAIKNAYPAAYTHYRNVLENKGLELGKAYPVIINSDLVIWNAITQFTFGAGMRQVSYDAVQTCFEEVNNYIKSHRMTGKHAHVHIPLIGAGRGGGNWNTIKVIIEETMDYPVTLWLPDHTVTTR